MKVENLVGLKQPHSGRFRILCRLCHVRDINHMSDINDRLMSSTSAVPSQSTKGSDVKMCLNKYSNREGNVASGLI